MTRTRLYLKESKEKDRQWESKIAFRFIRENALFRKYDDIYKQPSRKTCVTLFARGIEKVVNNSNKKNDI